MLGTTKMATSPAATTPPAMAQNFQFSQIGGPAASAFLLATAASAGFLSRIESFGFSLSSPCAEGESLLLGSSPRSAARAKRGRAIIMANTTPTATTDPGIFLEGAMRRILHKSGPVGTPEDAENYGTSPTPACGGASCSPFPTALARLSRLVSLAGPEGCNMASQQSIAKRAHELYLQRGSEPGHDLEDWLQAEAELAAAESP